MKPKIKKHITKIEQQTLNGGQFNPKDVAKSLSNIREYDVGLFFSKLSTLENRHLGEVLLELPSEAFTCALRRIPPHRLAAAVESIESDEATDLIQNIHIINEGLSQKVLALVQPEDRSEIEELSKYNDEQAGAYMEREFLAARMNDTVSSVKELIKSFRDENPASPIVKLFIVDKKGKLLNALHFTDLMLYEDTTTLKEIIDSLGDKSPLTIRPYSPIHDVVRLFEEYDLNIIAVINKSGKLIGRIVYDDIYDMIRHLETDRAYGLAGVKEESEEGSILTASKQRLIWLCVNLCTVLLASFIIEQFNETIAEYVVLAALLPIVAALGGNAGMQALTVTIRKLALGEVEYEDTLKTLRREILIVLGNGSAIALLSSSIVYIWFGDMTLSGVMALSIFTTLLIAGTAGTLIPIGLNKLGVDPAISSSIFLTTTTDILGFFIFLFLADIFL